MNIKTITRTARNLTRKRKRSRFVQSMNDRQEAKWIAEKARLF